MKINSKSLKKIIKEEACILLEAKINLKIKKLKTNEEFKQNLIAGLVSLLADKERTVKPDWFLTTFKPKIKEKFKLSPKELAILITYMKEKQEITKRLYDDTKSALRELLPKGSKLLKDFPDYRPDIKNLKNPVPMGPKINI